MRWKNKGHEFDMLGKRLEEEYKKRNQICIFGAGILGKWLNTFLRKYKCVKCFIDNDINKQEKIYEGKEVISFVEYLERDGKSWIVIAADKKNIPIIREQLEKEKLILDYDFFELEKFIKEIFPIVSVYCLNKTYIELAQICLTERCTLKCKKCAHACYAVDKNAQDLTLEQVFESADVFFEKVDWILEFVLMGGEPFLYKDLDKVIEYIGNNYRDQMMIYSITTNGTIKPSQQILNLCRKYKCMFRISNYSYQIPRLEEKYEQLIEILKKNQIEYSINPPEHEWMDYGFEYVENGGKKEELIKIFDACRTPCREIRENRFYYCVMARSVSDNLNYKIGEDDFLDMNGLDDDYKKVLLEFTSGYSDKGYLDMCNHCHGADSKKYLIPVAEQINE